MAYVYAHDAEEFEKLMEENKQKVVIVDYFAEWCGPCKRLGPILQELVKELDGKLAVIAIDVDEVEDVASENQIKSLPTLHFFVNGVKVEEKIGFQDKQELLRFINKISE